jgi:hypothetical protein
MPEETKIVCACVCGVGRLEGKMTRERRTRQEINDLWDYILNTEHIPALNISVSVRSLTVTDDSAICRHI